MSERASPSGVTGALFGLLAFGVFAIHDVAIKYLGGSYSVFQIVFFTSLFSLPLILFLLIFDRTEGNLMPRHPGWMALRACIALVTTASIFFAFTALKLTEVYGILFTTPLFVTALSVPVLKESVGLYRWMAVLVGFLGVLIVLEPGVSPIGIGHIFALLGAFGAACAFVIVRKIGQAERTAVMMVYPVLANLVGMTFLLPFVYQPMPLEHLGITGLMSLLGFLAMLSVLAAYRRASAVVVAPMQYSQILWALAFGALLFDESLDRNVAIGSAVIIASGIFILWRENRLRR